MATLKQAEFEEGEYRAALFSQLQGGHFVWEPGQVFEQYIGIDAAMWSACEHIFWLHGLSAFPPGVVLPYFDLRSILGGRRTPKVLPPFKLNLFIQAKRPMYGRRAPGKLKGLGLGSPYWRFETTAHQQKALEGLASTLGSKAIVCYACPGFHKQETLYKWMKEPKMVENSTFPDALQLAGHEAWNFSMPGTFGIANAEPTYLECPPLEPRIVGLLEGAGHDARDPQGELALLAAATREAARASASFLTATFFDLVRSVEKVADTYDLGDRRAAFVDYLTIHAFAQILRVNWFVVGRMTG